MDQHKVFCAQTYDQFVPFMKEKELKNIVASLAHTVSSRYEGEDLCLIGILKGCVVFMSDLMREIKNVNLSVDFVKLEAHGRTSSEQGTMSFLKDLTIDLKGKNVMIIEEVIDTGRALEFLIEHIKGHEPKKLEILTLFDKPYQRKTNIKPDYVGKRIENQFIIGYGLDLDEHGRNLDNIYYLKYPQ